MNWELDLNMKNGQIARSCNDNGSFCIMETIEGKAKCVHTLIGPVVYEYETSQHKYFLPSFQPASSKPLMKKMNNLLYWVLMFIGVFTLTLTLLNLWGN